MTNEPNANSTSVGSSSDVDAGFNEFLYYLYDGLEDFLAYLYDPSASAPPPPPKKEEEDESSFIGVVEISAFNNEADDLKDETIQIGIFISGMTCSMCIKSATNAIKMSSADEDGIEDVKINLSTEYALVKFNPRYYGKGGMEAIEEIVESIEDAGYEATLDKSTIPASFRPPKKPKSLDIGPIQIGIFISGMTCSMCVKSATNAIKMSSPNGEDGIDDVKINLSTEYALVTFDPRRFGKEPNEAIDIIVESIEDAGYDATLDKSTIPAALRDVKTTDSLDSMEKNGGGGATAASSTAMTGEDRANMMRKRQEDDMRAKLRAFLLSLIGTLPIMLITMVLGYIPAAKEVLMSTVAPGLTLEALLLWILATPVQFGSGWPFYRSSYHNLKNRMLGMDVLVAMGTSTAYFYSVGLISKGIHDKVPEMHGAHFFETSAVLISFVLLGKWLQTRAVRKTSSALEKLMGLAPKTALLVTPENPKSKEFDPLVDEYTEKEVSVDSIESGDIVKIIRGMSVPADGMLLAGELSVVESMITGEPMPVYKSQGSKMIGGTIVAEGTGFMIVKNVGRDTALSKICRMVEEAAASQAPIQQYADKVSSVFVPIVVIISILTFVMWVSLCSAGTVPEEWLGDNSCVTFSLLFGIAVLVISCPCALGLATPTAVMVGTGVGATHGILIKGGEQLQAASEIQSIIFDKTGTLTKGEPVVSDYIRITDMPEKYDKVKNLTDEELLWLLACLERNSEHPLATAVVNHCVENMTEIYSKLNPLVDPTDFVALTGKGVSGTIKSFNASIGNRKYSRERADDEFSDEIQEALVKMEAKGKTAVLAVIDGVVAAVIGISDAIREDSLPSIRYLREKKNVEVWLVTGDNSRTAAAVAENLGLPKEYVIAEALPSSKLEKVKSLQAEGKVVAMVGDGINDSPALAQADVGIAIGSMEIAAEAADMVLVKGDVSDVCSAIDLARTIFLRIRLNYLWALLYNCLGIPIAAGVFYPVVQMRLPPTVAAVAMALSSISVVLSSLALKLYKPPDILSHRS